VLLSQHAIDTNLNSTSTHRKVGRGDNEDGNTAEEFWKAKNENKYQQWSKDVTNNSSDRATNSNLSLWLYHFIKLIRYKRCRARVMVT